MFGYKRRLVTDGVWLQTAVLGCLGAVLGNLGAVLGLTWGRLGAVFGATRPGAENMYFLYF